MFSVNWDGRLASGEYAPAGTYKMAVRALKIFGDSNEAEEYELAETAEFSVQYMSSEPMPLKLGRRHKVWRYEG